MTRSEHEEMLKAEGRYEAMIAKKDAQRVELEKLQQEYAEAEVDIVNDLRSMGAEVDSVWDLVNSDDQYSRLIPILIDHLSRPYPDRIREGIARALAVPEASSVFDELVGFFEAEEDSTTHGLKWALHLAVSAAAKASDIDTLIRLAIDKRHGMNRMFLVDAIARVDDPKAHAALLELARDPQLSHRATEVCRDLKLRTPE